ncbi:MAG: hypothetical protein AAB676_10170 [Verrucomicrobiota bacterium]
MLPDDDTCGFGGEQTDGRQSQPPLILAKLGETTIRLPLGGVASSDPMKLRSPLVRPFWLLAALAAAAIGLFIWLRLSPL